jgi:hypothetical protein
MKQRIKRSELDDLAARLGVTIQHDCGGFRVANAGRYLFPDGGVCPTASARECLIFMKGMKRERDTTQANGPDHWIT